MACIKHIYLLILILFTLVDCSGQSKASIILPKKSVPGNISNIDYGCSYDKEFNKTPLKINYPDIREVDEIKKILSYTGLPMNFEIFSANIENAAAIIIGNKRIILYDPRLLQIVDRKSNTYWTSVSILAHEIGHHLSGHTLAKTKLYYQTELEADKFSGFVLYKMGASMEQSTEAILLLANNSETLTHPDKMRRAKAIEEGWNEAAKLRYEGAIPPPPEDIPVEYGTFLPDMLHDEDFLNRNNVDSTNPSLYVGIITEVDPEYNAGGLEIFVERKLKNADLKKNNENIIEVNTKKMFNLEWSPSGRMSQVEKSWFYQLLKPGRKIIFSCIQEGSGGYLWITYLQAVPAKLR